MSEENLEEWDAAFLEQVEQVIQAKERSLSLPSSSTSNLYYLPPQPPQIPLNNVSYSPPRELSQRIDTLDQSNHFDRASNVIVANSSAATENVKDIEIQRLTRELGRVSKLLAELEHECSELKKEKTEKSELIKLASSKNNEKVANFQNKKPKNLNYGVPAADHHFVPQQFRNARDPDIQVGPQINAATSSCKAIGVQVDIASHLDLPEKLRAIWDSPRDQKLGKSLISKLFVDCSEEFHVLFSCMNINTSSKTMDCLAVESSDVPLQLHSQSYPCSEAAKISHFYSVLTKISKEMIQLEALLGPLLDLCRADNVVVVNKSLRILHVFLKHLLSLERKAEERDNVMVEGIISKNNMEDLHGSCPGQSRLFRVGGNKESSTGYIPFGTRFSAAETLGKKGLSSTHRATSFSCVNWVSLFELMHQTTMRVTDQYVRSEAISIMNMIVMSSYSFMDREKFGQDLVFENISQLLKKEAGSRVQREAVRLLYLLLNCPKIFVTFCSGCKEESAAAVDEIHENPLPSKGFSMILEGLVECIGCCGNSAQDLELRRNAVIVIAFIVSSGKSDVEILSSQKLCGEANFLILILQELASEIDSEAADYTVPPDVFRARTLLIRETLILLNRLVSNPAYSSVVLQVLTNSRDMASLTIDVATRLSRKVGRREQSESLSWQMRQSEVVELGRIFRKRIFTYLGDNVP